MLDFTLLGNTYKLLPAENQLLKNYPPLSKEDWTKGRYEQYKQNIKRHLILKQFDRCAYCRNLLETDGKYEPLDHIVPQSIQEEWIFKVKNLILTCDSCNNLKSKEQTLANGYEDYDDLPQASAGYKIFNPHFDNWGEHLLFENDLFIVAKANSKGKETIRICKLYRYNVIVNRAKELKIGQQDPAKRTIHRFSNLKTTDPEYVQIRDEFLQAIAHFLERVKDDNRYQ